MDLARTGNPTRV
ncbi:hypothetical protein F383_37626 [Gossypium arboreum]|uniref:Uncharacterized protein n=1 Tax=Gossypium arboreum TaxID=29729 RepID=A0A0B0M8P9_GOSAR|nr:hypothetical protein F383_37628 [Gossypium arboreum]KHF98472.1 hypothetical protein F383_37626 [Gossypium arboreum]